MLSFAPRAAAADAALLRYDGAISMIFFAADISPLYFFPGAEASAAPPILLSLSYVRLRVTMLFRCR